jgi:cytochrome P450
VAHARKRRVIGQAFSDSAIRSFEDHVLEHVNTFVAHLSQMDNGVEISKKLSWSLPMRNMANLCKKLLFEHVG